jgi:hypothetical protein
MPSFSAPAGERQRACRFCYRRLTAR